MEVTLLTYTPEPEKVVAAAAKLCYAGDVDIKELMDNLTPSQTNAFVKKLADMGHESPFEHVSFTFGVQGVSRALLSQATRHRLSSYSVRSQRYCDEQYFTYEMPVPIQNSEELSDKYKHLMNYIADFYAEMVDNGIKKEDARSILPNACDTSFVVTMNARELFHFFNLRICNRAQAEIREMATRMFVLVKQAAPALFKNAGASCDTLGYCPEGKMSCGKKPTLDKMLAAYEQVKSNG